MRFRKEKRMEKTLNIYYNYPNKELWEDNIWQGRSSKIIPLAHKICDLNYRYNRINAKEAGQYRAEGDFDVQQTCWIYPDVIEGLKRQGLHFHTTRHCIYITPIEHLDKKGYTDAMDTLFILANIDFEYENWAMDTLEQYQAYIDLAAEKYMSIMFIGSDGSHYADCISLIQEAIVLFHYNYNRLYLDVSPVIKAGHKLTDGVGIDNPDDYVINLGGFIDALDISGRWANKISLTQELIMHQGGNAAYLPDKVVFSVEGKKMAEAISLELQYNDAKDPKLLRHFDDMGLKYDFNQFRGEQWIMFTPKAVLKKPDKKIPVMCILQEVGAFDPHQAVTAFSYCYEYFNIAAQGDCMLLFFALEGFDDNNLLHDILEEAKKVYPLDSERIYITGHSHNGRFTAEYMRRFPKDIAAMATLGNEPGQIPPEYTSGFFQVSDEKIDLQSHIDMPTINISGYLERNCMFPLYSDAPNPKPGSWIALNTKEKRMESWQRRLKSARCPATTIEKIAATQFSDDYVERMLGIPADKTECLYIDGHENYIADIKNVDGKYHLRIVALGNMPHTITPTMINLTWSYVRRFARNQETGATVELY